MIALRLCLTEFSREKEGAAVMQNVKWFEREAKQLKIKCKIYEKKRLKAKKIENKDAYIGQKSLSEQNGIH